MKKHFFKSVILFGGFWLGSNISALSVSFDKLTEASNNLETLLAVTSDTDGVSSSVTARLNSVISSIASSGDVDPAMVDTLKARLKFVQEKLTNAFNAIGAEVTGKVSDKKPYISDSSDSLKVAISYVKSVTMAEKTSICPLVKLVTSAAVFVDSVSGKPANVEISDADLKEDSFFISQLVSVKNAIDYAVKLLSGYIPAAKVAAPNNAATSQLPASTLPSQQGSLSPKPLDAKPSEPSKPADMKPLDLPKMPELPKPAEVSKPFEMPKLTPPPAISAPALPSSLGAPTPAQPSLTPPSPSSPALPALNAPALPSMPSISSPSANISLPKPAEVSKPFEMPKLTPPPAISAPALPSSAGTPTPALPALTPPSPSSPALPAIPAPVTPIAPASPAKADAGFGLPSLGGL